MRIITTDNGTQFGYATRTRVQYHQGRYFHVMIDTISRGYADMITNERPVIAKTQYTAVRAPQVIYRTLGTGTRPFAWSGDELAQMFSHTYYGH